MKTRSTAMHVMRRIRARKRGWVFTVKDFLDFGTRSAADQALYRLSRQGTVVKLERGIYYYPAVNREGHELPPDADAVARAIAAQTGETIRLDGHEAAWRLGFIEEPPEERAYLTSGMTRVKHVADMEIRFRHTAVQLPGQASQNVRDMLQALLWLGRERITPEMITRARRKLTAREKTQMRRMAARVPGWLATIIHEVAKEK